MQSIYTIDGHKLLGDKVEFNPSPNHSGKFPTGLPDVIVIHFTAGSSFASSVAHLCNENAKASAHIVIGREGQVSQLVPFDTVAWHAGKSHWQGRSGLNQYSIGIELDNAGELSRNNEGQYLSWFNRTYPSDQVFTGTHRNKTASSFWHAYTEKQIAATFEICQLLSRVYQITEVVGHEEIAPQRKNDPGPAFPLDRLRSSVLDERAMNGSDETLQEFGDKQVIASSLNVRSGPGQDFVAVAKPLVKGQKVKVVEKQIGWSKVEFTATGWVNNRFIE